MHLQIFCRACSLLSTVFVQFSNFDLMEDWYSTIAINFPGQTDAVARELTIFHEQSGLFAREVPKALARMQEYTGCSTVASVLCFRGVCFAHPQILQRQIVILPIPSLIPGSEPGI
jgi:hypothetical protein